MTYLIAAAGTGGHVFPGLAVGEALVDLGVPRDQIIFVGGDRLESKVYPDEGFAFLQVQVRGLQRSLTPSNLTLPMVLRRAKNRIRVAMEEKQVKAALGMGGYVTIPAALAARSARIPFLHSEQNAEAGLANRFVARWAVHSFGSFPQTGGLPRAVWVGNPVRTPFWTFDRSALLRAASERYGLHPDIPVLGVFGGSLGAGVINAAVTHMIEEWGGPPIQVVHLTGARNYDELAKMPATEHVNWVRVGFEESMEFFYAATDLVLARAGGAVAELTATGTPSILVPGEFGSSGHQSSNARHLTEAGAAVTVAEADLDRLNEVVLHTLFDKVSLREMKEATQRIAKPDAARTVAGAMVEAGQ